MNASAELELIAEVRKSGKLVDRGLVTAPEFINKVFDLFADIDRVYSEIIPALWDSIPRMIRDEFERAARQASHPEFRYRPFRIGGGRPITDEEMRQDSDLRTARVRAWARELSRPGDSRVTSLEILDVAPDGL